MCYEASWSALCLCDWSTPSLCDPVSNGSRGLPVFGLPVGSVEGPEFLYILLCSSVCVLWPPGQPGVWGISVSTAELVQTVRGLRTHVAITPTVSSDVMIPSPSTCFLKFPARCLGVLYTLCMSGSAGCSGHSCTLY